MKTTFVTLLQLGLIASLLSGCGQKQPTDESSKVSAEQPKADAAMGTSDSTAMSNDMQMPAEKTSAQEHSAMGTVTAVDAAAGTVTIAHEAVASAGWPAMTMAFKLADPKKAAEVHVNDHVKFTFSLGEKGDATVTTIEPADSHI